MRTVFSLLALTLVFGFAAIWILGAPVGRSKRRRSWDFDARRARRTMSRAKSRLEQVRIGGRRLASKSAGARRLERPRPRSMVGAVRFTKVAGPLVVERPLAVGQTSKAAASSKLVLSIIGYGAGMAILTVLVLRWIAGIVQQIGS